LTAGVEAIASAFPVLWAYRLPFSLLLLLIMTLINLRGLQETGTVMSIPVYLFLFTYLPMLGYGLIRLAVEGPQPLSAVAPSAVEPLTTFLILRTFATGCTALTGVEAISNGVPAFKPPEARNARHTLWVMAVLMAILFLGSIGLAQVLAIIPSSQETVLSALAHRLFGNGPLYYVVQISTLLILAVAANTSFADFPRLSALLAKDGYLPHTLMGLGDRLVYANGIIFLSVATGIIIIIFGADTHALIPLFAVGAFLAFTLSQAGMVVHWMREKGKGWQWKALANGMGASATGTAVLIIIVGKFTEGAWMTLLIIPTLILVFRLIRRHYLKFNRQVALSGILPLRKRLPPPRVVVPISAVNRVVVHAMAFALSISADVTGVYVELEPGTGDEIRRQWLEWWPDVPLEIVPSPYRSTVGPLLDYLDDAYRKCNDGQHAVVVLPEIVLANRWQSFLHNQAARLIKDALLYKRHWRGLRRIIIDVPYHL
jgi:amino acid transporter